MVLVSIIYLNIISILFISLTFLPIRICDFFNLLFLIITILNDCICKLICHSPKALAIVIYIIKKHIFILSYCRS